MGKFMKKAKEKGEVAVMEVVQPSSIGVRTRAKTLALKRHQRAAAESGDGSYLELRSRRLEKPAAMFDNKRHKCPSSKESNSMLRSKQRGGNGKKIKKKIVCLETVKIEGGKDRENMEKIENNEELHRDCDKDGSSGEYFLEEFDDRERITRERTPCNLVKDPVNIRTPGSRTKNPREAHSRLQNPMLIPTTQEMDEFFSGQEEQQCKRFIEKYNFDPVNDKPLPGYFEWVKLVL